MPHFLKRTETWVYVTLIVLATVLLTCQITRPLIDYDEAIYAKIIVDTMKSGDITTLSVSGHPWFEKPPLYFWSAMPFVAIFGPQEWAFRVPAIVASIVCLLLTYLVVRHLSNSIRAATISFLVLLFAPWFFFFSMEARLDSGVIAAMLASLLVAIKGWQKEKYLLWFFPLIAIGFLIKSVIVFLVIPIALIYSFFYNEWGWFRSRHLWLGTPIGAALLAPWFILESVRFGGIFWQTFFTENLGRVTSTVTGTYGVGDYLIPLMTTMPTWFWTFITLIFIFILSRVVAWVFEREKDSLPYRQLWAPLASAIFIFVFFTTAQTHLGAYVLPAYPFLAMFMGQFAYSAIPLGKRVGAILLIASLIIVSGAYYCFSIPWTSFQDIGRFVNDEMHIGKLYRAYHAEHAEPFYSLKWGGLDTLNFYSGIKPVYVDPFDLQTRELKAPFFFVTTIEIANILSQKLPQLFDQFRVEYKGEYLIMFYSKEDITVGGN